MDFDDEDEAVAEFNYILGLERALARAKVGISLAFIHYPGAASELEYDVVELTTCRTRRRAHGSERHDDFFAGDAGGAGKAWYLTFGSSRQVTESMSLSAHVGRQWHQREDIAGSDYHDWGVAVEWSRDRFGAALRFSDTDNQRVRGSV